MLRKTVHTTAPGTTNNRIDVQHYIIRFICLLLLSPLTLVDGNRPLPNGDSSLTEKGTGLRKVIYEWIKGGVSRENIVNLYGNIEWWNISGVTNMNYIFKDRETFNADISAWDTSRVTTMTNIFQSSKAFNQDLSRWKVSKVTNLKMAFSGAESFNKPLDTWNISNVRSLSWMFAYSYTFNQDISKWVTSKVTDMDSVFYHCTKFNSDISKWDVSKVTQFENAFAAAQSFNADVSKWDVSNVKKMTMMFKGATSFAHVWCNLIWDGKINKADFINSNGMMACCSTGKYNIPSINSPYITCHDCMSGTFTNIRSIHTFCDECPSGWYQSSVRQQFCFPCEPGRYQDESGQLLCKDCPIGTYVTDAKQNTSCKLCGKGFYNDRKGQSTCKYCPTGTYSNLLGVKNELQCIECNKGTYSTAKGAESISTCITCQPGKRGLLIGAKSETETCFECFAGLYRSNVMNSTMCEKCKVGYYSSQSGQTVCLRCIPGFYQNELSSSSCKRCPLGWFQNKTNSNNCMKVAPGEITDTGGSMAIKVALGWQLSKCKIVGGDNFLCSESKPCPAGTIGNDPPSSTCSKCPAGWTSSPGALSCQECEPGKFSSTAGATSCSTCVEKRREYTSKSGSIKCKLCAVTQKSVGKSCSNIPGLLTAADCKIDEYLDDSNSNPKLHSCIECPIGSSCIGSINFNGIKAKFGWSRCHNNNATFVKCFYPAACLGGPNLALTGMFLDENGKDLANCHENCTEQCNAELGHLNPPMNNSRCTFCRPGYAPDTNALGKCRKCDTSRGGMIIVILFIIFAIFIFILLTTLKMKSSGKKKSADSVLKRTILTHTQMVSIIMSLNVSWPPSLRSILVGFSSAINVSRNAGSTIQCHTGQINPADVFYTSLTLVVLLPIIVFVISIIYWFWLVPSFPSLGCTKSIVIRKMCQIHNPFKTVYSVSSSKKSLPSGTTHSITGEKIKWKSNRDGFIVTNVYFLYISFPSIVRMSFETFQCVEICGIKYLSKDDTEQCNVSRHFNYVVFVALPTLVIYLLILPSLTMFYLWVHRRVLLTDHKLMLRFGLLYSGYSRKRWYWEVLVVLRKVCLIIIITFGQTSQSQLHFALGALIIILYLQERGRPFENDNDDESLYSKSSLNRGARTDSSSSKNTTNNPLNTALSTIGTTIVMNEIDKAKKQKSKNYWLHLMEVSSLIVLITMVWIGVFFTINACKHDNYNCLILSILVLISNILFFSVCTLTCFKHFKKKHRITAAKVFKKIRRSFASSKGKQCTDKPAAALGIELNNITVCNHENSNYNHSHRSSDATQSKLHNLEGSFVSQSILNATGEQKRSFRHSKKGVRIRGKGNRSGSKNYLPRTSK